MKFQLSNISITGRVSREVEMRYSPDGMAVSKFSVPVNYGEKNSQGEWENKTNWWNITVFGKQAEDVNMKLVKGDLVAVTGTPVCRTYNNKEGVEKFSLEIQYANVFKLSKDTQPEQSGDGVTEIASGSQVSDADLPF